MVRKFFALNEIKGVFLANEEELCKKFCKDHGYTYRVVYFDPGY